MTANGWRAPGWRVYDAHPRHGKAVRDWIAHAITAHGRSADPGTAALAVSELFSNAVLHGPQSGRVLVGYCLWSGGDPHRSLPKPTGVADTGPARRVLSVAGARHHIHVAGRHRTRRPTISQLADLPVTTSLMSVAQILGIGRTKAYELARPGEFPCLVIRVGDLYRVSTADLLRLPGTSVEAVHAPPTAA